MCDQNRYQSLFGRYNRDKLKQFIDYVKSRPEHYKLFRELAQKYRNAGKKRCGASLIGNVLRYELGVRHADDDFKINNNWLPLLARLLLYKDPSVQGFFELRD